MVEQLFDGLAMLPSGIVWAYGLSHLLAVKRKALPWAWVIMLALGLLFGFIRSTLDPSARVVGSIVVAVAIYLPFVIFSTHPSWAMRVVIALCSYGCCVVSEAVMSFLLVMLGGSSLELGSSLALSPLVGGLRVAHVCLLALLFWLLHRISSKWMGRRANRSAWLFVAFPAVQLALLAPFLLLGVDEALGWRSADQQFALYGALTALCLVCVAVDALYFHAIDRSIRTHEDAVRGELLQSAIERELARCDDVVRDVERAARLRHDLGNQLAVVWELASCGDVGTARAHVSTMLAMLEEHDSGDDGKGVSR